MLTVFGILIILSSIILGLIVLIQNPKGGGLSGTFGGVGNQFMGVKQTTDVLEKGTWVFAGVLGLLCLVSPAFIPKGTDDKNKDLKENINVNSKANRSSLPANTAPMPATQPQDSNKGN
jgi:preprotein translocase subunit SecG